jgi:hypothetical protein
MIYGFGAIRQLSKAVTAAVAQRRALLPLLRILRARMRPSHSDGENVIIISSSSRSSIIIILILLIILLLLLFLLLILPTTTIIPIRPLSPADRPLPGARAGDGGAGAAVA